MEEGLTFLAERVRSVELDGEPELGTPSGIYGLESLPIGSGVEKRASVARCP